MHRIHQQNLTFQILFRNFNSETFHRTFKIMHMEILIKLLLIKQKFQQHSATSQELKSTVSTQRKQTPGHEIVREETVNNEKYTWTFTRLS